MTIAADPSPAPQVVYFRADPDLLRRLDEYVAVTSEKNPAHQVTRSSVLRALVDRALTDVTRAR